MGKAIRFREERNWGRRMTNWGNDYAWPASPWDWVLEELKYVSMDSLENKKWKKAIAYKLANEAKAVAPKLLEEWRYRETSTKLVALKSSVMIKQAFYSQYTEMKRSRDEYPANPMNPIDPLAGTEPKKPRLNSRLQDIMRRIVATYGFQHDIPETTYKELYNKLSPKGQKKETITGAAPPIIKVQPAATAAETTTKNSDNDIFLFRFHPSEMVPHSTVMYESYDFNDDAPHIIPLRDSTADGLLVFPQTTMNDPLANVNMSNLPEIPLRNYDELLTDPLNILGAPKAIAEKKEPMTGPETEATPMDDSQPKKIVKKIEEEEGFIFFDPTKPLAHMLPKSEDTEFMDYMTHLPECSDPLYQKAYSK